MDSNGFLWDSGVETLFPTASLQDGPGNFLSDNDELKVPECGDFWSCLSSLGDEQQSSAGDYNLFFDTIPYCSYY